MNLISAYKQRILILAGSLIVFVLIANKPPIKCVERSDGILGGFRCVSVIDHKKNSPIDLSTALRESHKKLSKENQKLRTQVAASGFDHIITQAANLHQIDPNLIRAIILVESNYRQNALSGQGAGGLMQITADTATKLGIQNRFDPTQNIHGGTRYLRKLLGMFKNNMHHALAAYNAGPGRVIKFKGIPPIEQTQQYVKKVMIAYEAMKVAHSV